jgi:hypothetical protein
MAHGIDFPGRRDDSCLPAVTTGTVDDFDRLFRITELCVQKRAVEFAVGLSLHKAKAIDVRPAGRAHKPK